MLGRSSYLGSDLCKFHGRWEFDVRYGSLAGEPSTSSDFCQVPTADVRWRPTDVRQVDLEWPSLPGGLHPLLLADCWRSRQAGSQQSTPRA